MYGAFESATAFNEPIGTSWNVARVANMANLFSGAMAFNQNIAAWNTASVYHTASMRTPANPPAPRPRPHPTLNPPQSQRAHHAHADNPIFASQTLASSTLPAHNGSSEESSLPPYLRGLDSSRYIDLRQNCTIRAEASGTAELTVSRLTKCTVVLPAIFSAIKIYDCVGCTVLCGPVRGSIFVDKCRDCTLMLAAQQLRIHVSEQCDFYVAVKSAPIIEHCSRMRIAPFALQYPQLGAQLRECDLHDCGDTWKEVNDFNWLKAQQSPNWSILAEDERRTEVSD